MDGRFFDNETSHMQSYDVGFNGMYMMETEALANLADVIGRTDDAVELRARFEEIGGLVRDNLWNEETGMFMNRLSVEREGRPNGWLPALSPTLFYPLQAGKAVVSDERAASMMATLADPELFCVCEGESEVEGEGEGEGCYPLPSISRSDRTFLQIQRGWGGPYWRGRVWGPQMALVYWGLQRYRDVPEVNEVRSALVARARDMLLVQWRARRIVCENYSPDTASTRGARDVRNALALPQLRNTTNGHFDTRSSYYRPTAEEPMGKGAAIRSMHGVLSAG
jgi:putative isomerase